MRSIDNTQSTTQSLIQTTSRRRESALPDSYNSLTRTPLYTPSLQQRSAATGKPPTEPLARHPLRHQQIPAKPRPPLRPRHPNQHNALSLTAKPSATASAALSKMPVGDSRPRHPQLSAAAVKAGSRPPLTPKVAAKGPPSVTSLGGGRRGVGGQPQNQAPMIAGSHGFYNDEYSTPPPAATAAFLSTNITPRSGPRQNRVVESTNSTPSGTPNPDKTCDVWDGSRAAWSVPNLTYDTPKQSSPGGSQVDSNEAKFFYASDARGAPQNAPQQQRPVLMQQKSSSFFYANGSSADNSKRTTTSPPASSVSNFKPVLGTMPEPVVASKFFYANGTPDASSKHSLPLSGSASTVSSSSRLPPTRPGTSSSATGLAAPVMQRPVSPVKSVSTPNGDTLKSSAMPPGTLGRPQMTSPPALLPQTSASENRRLSTGTTTSPARGHARTGSVPYGEMAVFPKVASPQQMTSEPSSPPHSPGGPSHPALTMASLLQAVEDMGEEPETRDSDTHLEPPQSPTKSIHSTDAVSEMVANARRERKVQDLEITNASLEAINRTLERQLRKQTAELRRYRRLSRSGRISMPSAASSRVTSAAMSELPDGLSDVSENDETEEEDDSFEDSDISSQDSASTADALSLTKRADARRKRDERRLQLDLTKHQELLIDSQKINQSIKKCLNWTDVLIKEGQKALEYKVRVSDVELGGRVLAPPDEEEEEHEHEDGGDNDNDGRRSPTPNLGGDALPAVAGEGPKPPWSAADGAPDRDSGIELPADGG